MEMSHCAALIFRLAALVLVSLSAPLKASNADPSTTVPPAVALARLKSGNARFVADSVQHPNLSKTRRGELVAGQNPFAVILACADSRIPPELVFDQGLGDLFVIRVAGNVVNDQILGSVEYAVTNLGARLIVVLGHERCGAVTAARDTLATGARAPGHVQSILEAIRPAVEATRGQGLETTIGRNVAHTADLLRQSGPILQAQVSSGAVKVVGASYVLKSGEVTFDSGER